MTPAPGTIFKAVLMSVAISIGFSAQAKAIIAQWRTAPQAIAQALDDGMTQVLAETAASLKVNELSGANGGPGMRSRNLRDAITFEKTGPAEGVVGTSAGVTSPYAKAILGPDTTTIKPKQAKHLWVPIADNLNPSGVAQFTPRALFDQFGSRVKIFKSKAGNTVVFVEDPKTKEGKRSRFKRDTKAGRKAGDLKGKLMFVLKDEVTIQGTDALARGVQRMMPRAQDILSQRLAAALPGGGGA